MEEEGWGAGLVRMVMVLVINLGSRWVLRRQIRLAQQLELIKETTHRGVALCIKDVDTARRAGKLTPLRCHRLHEETYVLARRSSRRRSNVGHQDPRDNRCECNPCGGPGGLSAPCIRGGTARDHP